MIDAIVKTFPERTTAQVHTQSGFGGTSELTKKDTDYKTYRKMRNDPTIALVRMLSVSSLISAGWMYTDTANAPPGAKEFIAKVFEPLRINLVKTAIEGYIDFGWSPYEMVKKVNDEGFIEIDKFKPLLQEFTHILVDKDTGEYIGMRQYSSHIMETFDTNIVDLSIYDSFLATFDVEGTDFYGTALMENARLAYDAWNIVEAASDRYDKKVAGTTVVVKYPIGESPYNGVMTDNFEIAKIILNTLESSGKIVVPCKIQMWMDDMNMPKQEDAWKIELLTDEGQGRIQFIERCDYLDKLKVRAFGIPERAILEGQFGTKAESATQAVFGITNAEVRHILLCQQITRYAVNLLLELNWGKQAKNTVNIVANPISDDKINFYRQIFTDLMKNPTMVMQEIGNVDMVAMREKLGLPAVHAPILPVEDPNMPVVDPMADPNMPPTEPIQPQIGV